MIKQEQKATIKQNLKYYNIYKSLPNIILTIGLILVFLAGTAVMVRESVGLGIGIWIFGAAFALISWFITKLTCSTIILQTEYLAILAKSRDNNLDKIHEEVDQEILQNNKNESSNDAEW